MSCETQNVQNCHLNIYSFFFKLTQLGYTFYNIINKHLHCVKALQKFSSFKSQALKLLRLFKPAEETCIKHNKIYIRIINLKAGQIGGWGSIMIYKYY